MDKRRGIIVSVTLTGLMLAQIFLAPTTTYAAGTSNGTPSTPAQMQATISAVQSALSGFSTAGKVSCEPTVGAVAQGGCYTASASKSGFTPTALGDIPYQAGDQITCAFSGPGLSTPVGSTNCAVKNKNGTSYYVAGVAYYDVAVTDASGKAIAGGQGVSEGNIFSYAGNVASACTGNDPGSSCGGAVVAPVASAATDALTAGLAGVGSQILQAVASAILSFSNFLLGLAGAALNYVVYYAVFKFGSLIGNSPGVLLAWGILRDIANMLLLFGFIFLGVATILDSDKFATKKAIPQLLIFAILMNFSLFACEAIIDVANGTSSLLYSQADPMSTQCNGSDVGRNLGDKCSFLNYGIAGHIMQSTGLSTFWQNVTNPQANPIALLALALFATIGTIVCLAAAIMLTIRLVVLTFLMISSPIGFAGMAIPFFHKFSNDWWNRVIHQSFFAPIMFLLIFISLKLADSFSSATSQSAGLGAVATSPNALDMGVILVFMLVCGFLLASIIVAHRFGAMGAQGAIGFSKKLVLGAYGGIGGVAGTNTLGRGGAAFQKRYQQWAGNRGRLARTVLINSGLDAGIMKASDKVKNSKYGGSKSFVEVQKNLEARSGALAHAAEAAHLGKELGDAMALAQDRDQTTAVREKAEKDIARVLQQMSANDIAQTDYVKKGAAGIEILARNLSADKFDEMMKNKDLEADKKEGLIAGRFSQLEGYLGEIAREDYTHAGEVKKWSAKDLEQLAKFKGTTFNTLIGQSNAKGDSLISGDQFEALSKSNALTNTQKQYVKDNSTGSRIEGRLKDGKITEALDLMKEINGNKARAKLSSRVLTDPEVAKTLSVPTLLAIVTEDKLSEDDRVKLAREIKKRAGEEAIGQLLDPNLNQVAAAYYNDVQ